MNILVDTHVLLWWLSDHSRLSRSARQVVIDADRVFVSAATAWEIAIKVAAGRLDFQHDLQEQLERNHMLALPIALTHATTAGQLPRHHGDPFDRMLIAQASVEGLTLLTHDRQLGFYDISVVMA